MSKLICVVCGMEINKVNYSFNKEAFAQVNSPDNIKFCPFCGAVADYLIEDGRELNYDEVNLNDNALTIIDHAIKLEIFNGDFYKKASKIVKNHETKKMFEALSRIEFMHARIHKKIGGFKVDPVLRDMDYSKYDSDKVLLDMACKREKHAVEYYHKYEKDIEDETIKKVFEVLSSVEKEHIELTSK
ncbi:ferritin family protein [Clostridium sp. DJ247]|uniref:ferritin-like domain-containing protein n=1 Tax=Clostridium sp. DJ247 TaxID=2726188 RepID=UPI001623AAA4|nr:ferritin family protein [Clostridium sp. DJ247]MBC2580104.1 ferritin family protein [Clostridium sp. DJ247]